MRRKATKRGRLNENPNPHKRVHVTFPEKLLKGIKDNVKGKSTSEKIAKCAKLGYLQVTSAISTEISESE